MAAKGPLICLVRADHHRLRALGCVAVLLSKKESPWAGPQGWTECWGVPWQERGRPSTLAQAVQSPEGPLSGAESGQGLHDHGQSPCPWVTLANPGLAGHRSWEEPQPEASRPSTEGLGAPATGCGAGSVWPRLAVGRGQGKATHSVWCTLDALGLSMCLGTYLGLWDAAFRTSPQRDWGWENQH